MMTSGRRLWPLDPYVLLRELEYARVAYVVIGALARIIHGSKETTENLDIVPSLRPDNLRRLQEALEALNARRGDARPLGIDRLDAEQEPIVMLICDAGELNLVARPLGTRGYDDLRRRANREPVGEGLRPRVAQPADLVRMLEAHHDPVRDPHALPTMRRFVESRARRLIERAGSDHAEQSQAGECAPEPRHSVAEIGPSGCAHC